MPLENSTPVYSKLPYGYNDKSLTSLSTNVLILLDNAFMQAHQGKIIWTRYGDDEVFLLSRLGFLIYLTLPSLEGKAQKDQKRQETS